MRLEEFLFCEMARDEANGQLTLIGLFPGSMITYQLPVDAILQVIPNLAAVVILGDMERVRRLKSQCVVKHDNHDVVTTAAQEIQRPVAPVPFQSLVFGFLPFPCTRGPGDYEFRVTVHPDDAPSPVTFSKRFTVNRVSPSQQAKH
jgi:hypothetical protein